MVAYIYNMILLSNFLNKNAPKYGTHHGGNIVMSLSRGYKYINIFGKREDGHVVSFHLSWDDKKYRFKAEISNVELPDGVVAKEGMQTQVKNRQKVNTRKFTYCYMTDAQASEALKFNIFDKIDSFISW